VAALNAAQRCALESGRDVIMVENGELVLARPTGKTVLKKLPPRRKVDVRTKRAST
jgi:hypothetical protein